MSTLVEFLLARVAEDEAVARAAGDEAPSPWRNDCGTLSDARGTQMAGYAGEAAGPHIARHDPARVLAECEAKRRIVEAVASGFYDSDLEVALRDLAAVHADHPDYLAEWVL